MPQMAPLSWIPMTLIFISILMMMTTLIYSLTTNQKTLSNVQEKQDKLINKSNWKW